MEPLAGVRVIDLSQAEFGPRSTLMLADMGADVIKIEPREGEYTRPITRDYDREGVNAYFLAHNRNKRGLALDFKKPKGREIIYKLIERSDVFLTTYAPGSTEKYGLSYEILKKYNPRIIYVRGSGFGPKGPLKDRRAFDIALQAYLGLIHQNGISDDIAIPAGTAVIDQIGGLALAFGIVVALYNREKTGKGQEVSGSLLQAGLYCLSLELVSYILSGKLPPKSGRGHSMVKGLYHTFPTKDGWMVIAGIRNEPWPAFCRLLGIEHLENDPRFATTDDREEHRDELIPILDEKFRTKTTKEWIKELLSIDMIVTPVYNFEQTLSDPDLREQMEVNDFLVDVDVPNVGKVKVPGPIVKLSETPGSVRRPGFNVGEHTYEILTEIGYTPEEIVELIQEEVIFL